MRSFKEIKRESDALEESSKDLTKKLSENLENFEVIRQDAKDKITKLKKLGTELNSLNSTIRSDEAIKGEVEKELTEISDVISDLKLNFQIRESIKDIWEQALIGEIEGSSSKIVYATLSFIAEDLELLKDEEGNDKDFVLFLPSAKKGEAGAISITISKDDVRKI